MQDGKDNKKVIIIFSDQFIISRTYCDRCTCTLGSSDDGEAAQTRVCRLKWRSCPVWAPPACGPASCCRSSSRWRSPRLQEQSWLDWRKSECDSWTSSSCSWSTSPPSCPPPWWHPSPSPQTPGPRYGACHKYLLSEQKYYQEIFTFVGWKIFRFQNGQFHNALKSDRREDGRAREENLWFGQWMQPR